MAFQDLKLKITIFLLDFDLQIDLKHEHAINPMIVFIIKYVPINYLTKKKYHLHAI